MNKKNIIEVFFKNEKLRGSTVYEFDDWTISEGGQLVIRTLINDIPYKVIVASGQWTHIVEHPA
jgi:hypothetical protein